MGRDEEILPLENFSPALMEIETEIQDKE